MTGGTSNCRAYGIVAKDPSSCRAGQVVKAYVFDRTFSGAGWYTYICARTSRDTVTDRTAEAYLIPETATSGVGTSGRLPSDGDYYPVIAFRSENETGKSWKVNWLIVTDAD